MKTHQPFQPSQRKDSKPASGRYTDDIAARLEGETDKLYAKRVIDKLPVPALAFLPDEPWSYFVATPESVLLPVELLRSRRTQEENANIGTTALNRMAAARDGVLPKRAPIDVVEDADGKYTVIDGNSTLIAAQTLGWTQLPVLVVRERTIDASVISRAT